MKQTPYRRNPVSLTAIPVLPLHARQIRCIERDNMRRDNNYIQLAELEVLYIREEPNYIHEITETEGGEVYTSKGIR